ncbi:hypothetical protein CEXT_797101 [Caerostris extrusa]|uniref:Uncharacterized protein n=1 Tax=Caerostris extrusa TaxID=172846 RepID=A0AAV4P350_CAEEX|nr:hypothetical protein CEXT_797101 [Caerostris extrusa]
MDGDNVFEENFQSLALYESDGNSRGNVSLRITKLFQRGCGRLGIRRLSSLLPERLFAACRVKVAFIIEFRFMTQFDFFFFFYLMMTVDGRCLASVVVSRGSIIK